MMSRIAVVVGLLACAFSGALSAQVSSKMLDLSKMSAGQTTFDDVVREYGKPQYQSVNNDGSRYSNWKFDTRAKAPAQSRFGAFMGSVVSRAKSYAGNSAGSAVAGHMAPSTAPGSVVGGAASDHVSRAVVGEDTQAETDTSGTGSCSLWFDSQGRYLRGNCDGHI